MNLLYLLLTFSILSFIAGVNYCKTPGHSLNNGTVCEQIRVMNMAVFNVDKSHNNTELTCERGDWIILELHENPTTGFKWHIIDSEGLVVINSQFELDKQIDKNTIGAGGIRSLTFEFKGPQQASLHLEYYQQWEGMESSTDSFKLKVSSKS